MGRWDFDIFWRAGRAVWMGQDPYAVEHFLYPLPAAYFFALLAAFPQRAAFWVWLAFNIVLLAWKLRGRLPKWALYFPLAVIIYHRSGVICEVVRTACERSR